tara:strand:- start:14546 stop:14815 length:270 start_codon:yes stop_codon:yes gene_type:complete
MKPLTSLQKREAIERYCELVVDRMETEDLVEYVTQDLKERYTNMTDMELNEYINSIEGDETFEVICDDVREDYSTNSDNLQVFIPGFHD